MKLRITMEGISYEVEVEILSEAPAAEPEMTVPDTVLNPPVKLDLLPTHRICRSPIAGLVIAVVATRGAVVKKDDPIAVIEAMKMQTTIGAPVDGTVGELEVRPGDSVKPNQILCKII